LVFSTTADGASTPTERMRITNAGNVGIGTSSPSGKFDVRANTNGNLIGYLQNDSTGASSQSVWQINVGGRYTNLNANYSGQYFQNAGVNLVTYYQDYDTQIFRNNAGTERMRIDSSGNLLVGTTSNPSGASADVNLYSAKFIASHGYASRSGTTGSFTGNVFNIHWTGTPQLYIDVTNVGTISVSSDYRIKRNIETQNAPALDRIAQIRTVTYQRADYGTLFKADDVVREGFIAHELAEVIPSAVEGEKDAENQIQSLKLDALCSVMVKAIQEQQAIIESLKTRIETLEAQA